MNIEREIYVGKELVDSRLFQLGKEIKSSESFEDQKRLKEKYLAIEEASNHLKAIDLAMTMLDSGCKCEILLSNSEEETKICLNLKNSTIQTENLFKTLSKERAEIISKLRLM